MAFSNSYNCISHASTFTVNNAVDYYPYGKVLRSFYGSQAEKHLSTTNERDLESDLDYRWKRYSDPEIGRFLQVDPIPDAFVEKSSYTYVDDNPIMLTDPNGDCPWCGLIEQGLEDLEMHWPVIEQEGMILIETVQILYSF